jgi:hypothetical protein
VRKYVAAMGKRLIAPKNHVGSEDVNIFKVLCETLDLVEVIAVQITSHVRGSGYERTLRHYSLQTQTRLLLCQLC